METWKALNLGIESISRNFKTRNSKRFCNHLQEDKDPHSYIPKAARLYNLTTGHGKTRTVYKKCVLIYTLACKQQTKK